MTVKEFCSKYGMKYQTVYKRIKNNRNKALDGHITKENGRSMELDEYAENFLKSISVKISELEKECLRIVGENNELLDKIDVLNYQIEKDSSEISSLRSILDEQKEKYTAEIVERDNIIAEKDKLISEKDSIIADLNSKIEEMRSEAENKKGILGLFGNKS